VNQKRTPGTFSAAGTRNGPHLLPAPRGAANPRFHGGCFGVLGTPPRKPLDCYSPRPLDPPFSFSTELLALCLANGWLSAKVQSRARRRADGKAEGF
jgi:hypothetical protein